MLLAVAGGAPSAGAARSWNELLGSGAKLDLWVGKARMNRVGAQASPRGRVAMLCAILVVTLVATGAWCAVGAPSASAAIATLTGTEGTTIGGPDHPQGLAAFGYTGYATVDWGDGTGNTCQQGGTVTPEPGAQSFCYWQLVNSEFNGGVYGWHTYHRQGIYTITIREFDDRDNLVETATAMAYVDDAPLTPQSTTSNTLVNASASTVAGHFTDSNPYSSAGDYTAKMNWGDGTPVDSNATITGVGGSSGFDVNGTHAYASPSPSGGYDVTVTVTDAPGDEPSESTTIHSKVNATLTGSVSLTLAEGIPFSGPVAQFCGTPQPVTSATIDWGDGTGPDSGTTVQQRPYQGSTCYGVSAAHTYARPTTTSPHTLTVTPNASSGATAVTGSATVHDAALSSKLDANFLAANSLSIPQAVIAHVSDANTLAPPCSSGGACDLTAYVSWGDSSAVQTATVAQDPTGGFEVLGGPHEYPAPGSYTVTVAVKDVGGASTVANGTYRVVPPPHPRLTCQSPVPAVGATAGVYGARVPPGLHPNWGVSADDRVLRFGNLVLCAAGAPWVYTGPSTASQLGGLGVSGSGGTFKTKGRVIVNGLELEPGNGDPTPFLVDTSSGQLSGPYEEVKLSKEEFSPYPSAAGRLGPVNLKANPWVLQGDTLAYLPASDDAYAGSLRLSGPLRVVVDGLGTVAVTANATLPNAFSLQAYSGGPATGSVSFPDEYPGLLGGRFASDRRARARTHRVLSLIAHQAGGGCSYPPAPANAPINVHSDDLYLGGINMHCAYLYADPSTGTAQGGGGFGVGTAYVNGYFGFNHGNFQYAGGGADGLNIEVFPALTLNSIHFGVFLDPSRFHASATFQVGEGLFDVTGGNLTAFATGAHTYSYNQDRPITGTDDLPGTDSVISSPFSRTTVGIGAEFKPLGLFDVHGYVLYEFPAYVEIGGQFGYDIGVVSANGKIQGQFWLPRAFDIEGNLRMCFVGLCSTAKGLVSNRGLTGCWDVKLNYLFGSTTWSVGGAYRWGASGPSVYIPPFSDSCDDHFGDYRVTGASAAAAPDGPRTFHVGPGQHSVMVRVSGRGDAPAFTLTGPHGVRAVTGNENTLTGAGTVGLYRSQRIATSWVAIRHPGAGTWRITPQPGSSAITSVALAGYIPGASVRGHVSGRGYHRILRYSLRSRPGQVVRFVESAKGVTHSIARVSAKRGAIPFTPGIGRAGRRQIIAQVSRDGLLRAEYVVAAYVAPGTPRAARPPHLRVSRRRSQLAIRWGAAANATGGYQVVVITSDGRRLLFQRPAGGRGVTVPAFSSSGAKVMVEGVGPDGNTGRAAIARLKPLGAPARVRGLKIRRNGARAVRISWRPARGALSYRIAVTPTGSLRAVLIVTRKRTLSFTVKSSRVGIKATVQGEGALGVLGPKVTTHLAAKPPKPHRRAKKHRHKSAPKRH